MLVNWPYRQQSTDGAPDASPLLRLSGITKRFLGVTALEDVSFDLRRGEVHALCGENGAGKSTLMKILSGQLQPDAGEIVFKGQPTRFASTNDAQAAGIAMIHQELNLVPHLSVAQRQMVEIAKALSIDAEVLIMDEPTSSLTESETELLFKVIVELRRAGVALVYISHRLDEMARIVDRVTVLRDGRHVSTGDFAATSVDEVVVRMVGRALDDKFPPPTRVPSAEVLLSVRGLARHGVFEDVGFELRRGEILGFSGLMGAGRTEVARAVFGADLADAGTVRLGGETLDIRSPRDAIGHGIAYLSEDRKGHGLALNMTLAQNVTLANMADVANALGFIRFAREASVAQGYVDSLSIRTPST